MFADVWLYATFRFGSVRNVLVVAFMVCIFLADVDFGGFLADVD